MAGIFLASKAAAKLWLPGGPREDKAIIRHPAIAGSLKGGDVCELTRLAEAAVGAPFGGTIAGCPISAQVLRLLSGDEADALSISTFGN